MSASRAPKRRKLDGGSINNQHAHQSSPAPRPTHSPATIVTKGKPDSSPAVKSVRDGRSSAPSPSPRNTPSAHDVWKEAKAMRRLQRGRKDPPARRERKEVDVYDDIEGANVGREPFGRIGGTPAQSRTRPARTSPVQDATTPTKRALDPLRNQKVQQSASPKKASTSLGSFKRPPRPSVHAGTSVANGNRTNELSPKIANGTSHNRQSLSKSAEEEVVIEESEQESVDEFEQAQETPHMSAQRKVRPREESPVRSTTSGSNPKKSRWVYAEKKTFEDEIRELEEEARRKAHLDDSEDELASQSGGRRLSKRQPVQRDMFKPEVVMKTPKPLDKGKEHSDNIEVRSAGRHDPEDSMEIDVSEDEYRRNVKPACRAKPVLAKATVTPKKSTTQAAKKKGITVPACTFQPDELQTIQTVLLQKATRKCAIPLTNLDDEYAKVFSLVNQTVTAGESNSMLLIGARGSGKTVLIDSILREQTSKHPDDFHAVRLSGFSHTDDKIALREIWRQLGREMDMEDEEGNSKNYADTMSKLLALLSHPAETGTDQPEQVTKSVIFVLDEFELFATHPRQTLLYNLFDIAQSRKAPIAVLGLTTRIDVAESLEKRVKSRFSHRYVHLSLAKSLQGFQQICENLVRITPSDLTSSDVDANESTNDASRSALSLRWSTLAESILASEPSTQYLRHLYTTTKSIPDFLATLIIAVATMPVMARTTSEDLCAHFTTSFTQLSLQPPDSKLSLLPSLSTLQLALLICAARLTNIYNTEVISFSLAYEEYKVIASKAKLQASAAGATHGAGSRVWGKEVAKGAWDELVQTGLVMQEGRSGGKEVARVDVGLEEIGMSDVELGAWGRWCREI